MVIAIYFLVHIYQWYLLLTYSFDESVFDLILFYLYFINLVSISFCVSYLIIGVSKTEFYLLNFALILITQFLLVMLSFVLSFYHQVIGKGWREQIYMIYLFPFTFVALYVVESLVKK